MVFLLYPKLWMKRKYWEMGLWQKLLWLEWGLLASTWRLVILAMVPGWLQHRRIGPALVVLHFANRYMSLVALAAGLLLATAHLWNLRLRPACPRSGLSPRPNA